MDAVQQSGENLGIRESCEALGLPRATFYRRLKPRVKATKRQSSRALTDGERKAVMDVLHEPRFVDLSPGEVFAKLLDESKYLCSERTMYRILDSHHESKERRNQLRHPKYAAPELLAQKPNQLWSWDITKLHGPAKWTYFYLYVIMDVFSRYVVGWTVAHRENSALASTLIEKTCHRQGINKGQLTLHADRGSSMTSKVVAGLLADLGVTKTHSRPHVSNDNPFSEAQFKTLKYRPTFPERFGCIQDARSFCTQFFDWYNHQHHHSGIGMLTPADVHFGRAEQKIEKRNQVLASAYAQHPERFVRGMPTHTPSHMEVWINPPQPTPNQPLTGQVVV